MSERRGHAGPVGPFDAERDFLLRSLEDLETERLAGNLEPGAYRRLQDDYTARAAAVLRAIEDGVDARPVAAPTSWRRRLVVAGVLGGFAAVAAFLLVEGLGDRLPGQTASGNAQTAIDDRQEAFERRVLENPGDAAAHLDYARFLLENSQEAKAVKEYDVAARLDPANGEALAYAGWLVWLAASQAAPEVAGQLTDRALTRLDQAVAAAPDYPDARFFRGMVLFRGKDDAAAAVPEFERFLALVPEGPFHDRVAAQLDEARQAAG